VLSLTDVCGSRFAGEAIKLEILQFGNRGRVLLYHQKVDMDQTDNLYHEYLEAAFSSSLYFTEFNTKNK
jgi:hypothetical protein